MIKIMTVPKQPNLVFFAAKNAAINAMRFFILLGLKVYSCYCEQSKTKQSSQFNF